MGAFADFQTAIRSQLNANPALVAIIGAGKVLDDVPHASEPGAPAYPFVTIGDQIGTENGSDTHDESSISITLHAWSRYPGRLQALNILDAIRDALHNQSVFVAHGLVYLLLYQSHETLKDGDGETYHGVIRFAGSYQFG